MTAVVSGWKKVAHRHVNTPCERESFVETHPGLKKFLRVLLKPFVQLAKRHHQPHFFVNNQVYLMEPTMKNQWFPLPGAYDALWSVERIAHKKFTFHHHCTAAGRDRKHWGA